MDDKTPTIVANWLGTGSVNIFGLPFAGKDTQSHRVGNALGAEVIAGGDILRNHDDQATIKKLMSTGELFPTDYYFSIVLPYLSRSEFSTKALVLSSVGRWHGEEETIMEAAEQAGHPTKAVVLLRLDEEEIKRRFEIAEVQQDRGKRHDDDAEVLKVRLNEFKQKTMPVIEFYRHKGLLVEVDGSGTPEEVTAHILDGLLAFSKSPVAE